MPAHGNNLMAESSCGLSWIDIPEQADAVDAMLVPVPEKCIDFGNTAAAVNVNSASFVSTVHSGDATFASSVLSSIADMQHIFIEGDNYPTLKCLLAEWIDAIDMIYIDPPYNTGSNALTYNDTRFLKIFPNGKQVQKNNPVRHSAWLSFMHRRLVLARKLLAKSGCIFISIDDTEYARLCLLCDEIFGEENYVNDFLYLHGKGKKDTWSRTMTQHTVCYAKDKPHLAPFAAVERTNWATTNADEDARGMWFSGSISFTEKRSNPNHANYFSIVSPSGKTWTRQWLCSKQEMDALIQSNRIYWGADGNSVPRKKIFNGEESRIIPKNIIVADTTREAQRKLDNMLCTKHAFANPKPVNLIEQLLTMTQMKSDATVLDFFAGSGTTLEAVLRMNAHDSGKRRCILIQSSEKTSSRVRAQGGESPNSHERSSTCVSDGASANVHATEQFPHSASFNTIADIAYERARRVICGYTDSTGKRVAGFGGTLAYYVLKST